MIDKEILMVDNKVPKIYHWLKTNLVHNLMAKLVFNLVKMMKMMKMNILIQVFYHNLL